jgi:hypothetical protein
MIDVHLARADTPAGTGLPHFDNAGVPLMPGPVLETMQQHLGPRATGAAPRLRTAHPAPEALRPGSRVRARRARAGGSGPGPAAAGRSRRPEEGRGAEPAAIV